MKGYTEPGKKGRISMKTSRVFTVVLVTVLVALQAPGAFGGFGDFLKGLEKALGGGELTESKIIDGLKEALQVGAGNAVEGVSRLNGYYGNPSIRIPLPAGVRKVEKVLRSVGFGPQVEAFEESMNRAAEKAAPEAKALFLDTIKKMTFEDARKILKGRDNEATLYFRERTWDSLDRTFRPIVHQTMSKVGVTRQYQALDTRLKSIPFADRLSFDLDQYVTGQALEGLFLMLAEEERKIRKDPAARVTELLKEVFGGGK